MIRRSVILFAGLALPLSAQASRGVGVCVPPAAKNFGREINAGAFSLRVPAGDTALRVPSIDSQTGGWGRDGVRLVFDYGSYSNPLDSLPDLVQVRRSHTAIGGHAAVVITALDSARRLVVAAHWPALRPSGTGPISLTVYGTAADSVRQLELIAMVCSVRFGF